MATDLLTLNWGLLAPELTIVLVATIITLTDLFLKNEGERKIFGWFSILGILLAIYFVMQDFVQPPEGLLHDSFRVDNFSSIFKLIFLVGTLIVFVQAINYINKKEIKYDGEFYYLLLTALLGAMVMSSSADLITLYIGLELLSISSFLLAGLKKFNLKSTEAALKYVITGGVSSAIFLYGASFLYGITGSTNLYEIGQALPMAAQQFNFYIYLSFFLMLVGLSYKIAAVPSYMWAPDVYEGSPTPTTSFLSVVSKAAGFAIILRIFATIFVPFAVQFQDFSHTTVFLAVISGLTMLIGNTLALRQTNIQRLFGLSSVAHAGYLLIPFTTLAGLFATNPLMSVQVSINNILFYLIAYLIMNLGAFTVITIVIKDTGLEDIRAFNGLYHRNPLLAVAMTLFLISLAGLPISGGFIGKFNIFIDAVIAGSYWLAGIMVVASVISYFYYFAIVRQMYMRPGATEAKITVSFSLSLVVLILALAVLVMGLVPNYVYDFLNKSLDITQMFMIGQ